MSYFFILNFQFGFLERLGRNKHKFTRSRFDRADELLHSTNGIVKGMWVFDITQKEPRTPELCPKQRMFIQMYYVTNCLHYFQRSKLNLYVVKYWSLSDTLLKYLSSSANDCTVTDHGLVHSFDGVTQVAPAEFLTILSSTTQRDFSDDCNFENRIHMETRVCIVLRTIKHIPYLATVVYLIPLNRVR